jgi:hypothetical protein
MLTPEVFAQRLSISTRTARRVMAATLGVVAIGNGERRYYKMSEAVFEQYLNRQSVKAKRSGTRS